jgi:anhydro-N-acetylmuramic acid kinase
MATQVYKVLGVMSGTSLDGIDIALVTLKKTKEWTYEINKAITIPYSECWVSKLKEAISYNLKDMAALNVSYTTYLSNVINNFIQKHSLHDIDAVCSHGHTIKHEPDNGFTLQIGNLQSLALQLGKPVVCDFRVQDVSYGGQGAPLVPIGDKLLFNNYDYCLNLGGFANISQDVNNSRLAYDICPVNTVLNFYANKKGLPYDNDGKIASQGIVNETLLFELNELSFYKKRPPKSLGVEWVNSTILPIIESYNISTEDKIATFTEHCALQIASSLNNDNLKVNKNSKVLVTGGGAFNSWLINRISSNCNSNLHLPDDKLINFKEALVFALLGVLRICNEINVLSSVTGASTDHSSGIIFNP